MRSVIDNDWLTLLSRLLLGGAFIYASYYKIIEPASFAKSIWYYHLVPGSLIHLMALILPWLELLVGIGLIVGVAYRGSVAWVNIMLVLFIIALATTIVRGLDIECGCFKAAESATGSAWRSLLFDVALLFFSVQLIYSKSKRWMCCAE